MPPILTFRDGTDTETNVLTGMDGTTRGEEGDAQSYRVYNDFDLVGGSSTARMVKMYVFYQMDVGGLYRSSGVEAADQQWMEARLTGQIYDLDGAPVDGKTVETTVWKRFGGKTAFELPGVIPPGYGREIQFRINPTGSGGSIDFNDIRIGMSWDRGTDFLDAAADEREGRGILMPGGTRSWLLGGRGLSGAEVGLSPFRNCLFFVDDYTAAAGGDVMEVEMAIGTATFTEGVDYTAGVSNAATAISLAAAINAAVIGAFAQATTIAGKVVVRLQDAGIRVLGVTSDNSAFIDASNQSASLLFGEMSVLNPDEQLIEVARQISYPPFNDKDGANANLAATESYVVDTYKTPYRPTHRVYMYNSQAFGVGETVTIRVGVDGTPQVFTGVAAAPAADEFIVGANVDTATNLTDAINAFVGLPVTASIDAYLDEVWVSILSDTDEALEVTASEDKAWVAVTSDYVHVRGAKGVPGEPPASPGADYLHIARSSKVYRSSLSAPELMATHAHAALTASGADNLLDMGGFFAIIGGLVMRDDADSSHVAAAGASSRQYVKLTNGGDVVTNLTPPAPGEIFLGIVETNASDEIDFTQNRSWLQGRGTRLTRIRHVKESIDLATACSRDNEAYLFGYFSRLSSGTMPRTVDTVGGHRVSVLVDTIATDEEGIIELAGTELCADGSEVASMTERFLVTRDGQWCHGKRRWMGTDTNDPDVDVDSVLGLTGLSVDAYASDLFQNDGRPFFVKSLRLRFVPMGKIGQITAALMRVPRVGALETIFSVTKTLFPHKAAYVQHTVKLSRLPSGGTNTNAPTYATADEAVIEPWRGEGVFLKLSAFAGIRSVEADMEIDERVN